MGTSKTRRASLHRSTEEPPPQQRVRIDDLSAFLAVHRLGSVAAAAARLGVSQPTVTNRISGLEETLGGRLLDRTPTGSIATELGEEVVDAVGYHLDRIDQYLNGERTATGLDRVRIGVPLALATSRLLPVLGPAGAGLPRLDLDFSNSGRALLTAVADGELDLAVSTVRPRLEGLTRWPILDEEFVLVAAPGLVPGHATTGTLDDAADTPEPDRAHRPANRLADRLAEVPVIGLNRDLPLFRALWHSIAETEPDPVVAITAPDLLGIRSATLAGLGMSALPTYLIREDLERGTLVDLAPGTAVTNTAYLVARTGALHDRPGLVAFVERLLRLLAPGCQPVAAQT